MTLYGLFTEVDKTQRSQRKRKKEKQHKCKHQAPVGISLTSNGKGINLKVTFFFETLKSSATDKTTHSCASFCVKNKKLNYRLITRENGTKRKQYAGGDVSCGCCVKFKVSAFLVFLKKKNSIKHRRRRTTNMPEWSPDFDGLKLSNVMVAISVNVLNTRMESCLMHPTLHDKSI